MPILLVTCSTVTAGAVLVAASAKTTAISAERMLAHVNYLASDKLEGRAPGSPGEQKTVAYLTEQLTQMGCEPGNPDGTFVQKVPMYGFEVTNQPELVVRGNGGVEKRFATGKEFVGWTLRQTSEAHVRNAEMVFVGYGVEASEFLWNDYKTPVRGKVVVMLVNDPPMEDATLFGGKA
ncbi:MAG TPA: peptidase M28, partial [Candidatus Krumholzibacteria bacterium]|nr:peptidase M28 [Candidatus Krumholzibacteria bacterium]